MLRGVALLAMIACAREGARPSEPTPPPLAQIDAGLPADMVATCTDPRPAAEVRAAVESCAQHYRNMADGAGMLAYGESCADIYSAPTCRETIRETTAAGLSDESLLAAAQSCRDAYCPRLESPRPSVCTGLPAAIDDPTGAWDELFTAILSCDYESLTDARHFAAAMSPFKLLSLGTGTTPGNSP